MGVTANDNVTDNLDEKFPTGHLVGLVATAPELVDAFAEKSNEEGEQGIEGKEGEGSAETQESEEGVHEDADEDANEDGEESDDANNEEADEDVMDELADKLVDRVLQTSFHHSTDLDTATLAKPAAHQVPRQPNHAEVEKDQAFADESMLPDVLSLRGGATARKKKKSVKKNPLWYLEVAMKAMSGNKRAMNAMKGLKATKKAKSASKIAKGKRAKVFVFKGTKEKTSGGLTQSDLVKNKRGKIVSMKKSAAGKKSYSNIKGWTTAVMKARKAMKAKGFIPVKKGTPLYNKAKRFYSPRVEQARYR